jgi:hypothetical protein
MDETFPEGTTSEVGDDLEESRLLVQDDKLILESIELLIAVVLFATIDSCTL